jgi:YHS domain-containing protein
MERVMPRDPVCGREVDEKDAAAVSQQRGKTYYFCSEACKEKFERDPQQFGEARRSAVATATSSRGSSAGSDVVRRGGVAKDDAEAEDITRDTYGIPSPAVMSDSREERIANADRAAEQARMPGVDVPESPFEVKERLARDEPPQHPKRR